MWAELANHKPILTDDVPEDRGPLSPAITSRLPPLNASPEEARLLGYKSHRDDYERVNNKQLLTVDSFFSFSSFNLYDVQKITMPKVLISLKYCAKMQLSL